MSLPLFAEASVGSQLWTYAIALLGAAGVVVAIIVNLRPKPPHGERMAGVDQSLGNLNQRVSVLEELSRDNRSAELDTARRLGELTAKTDEGTATTVRLAQSMEGKFAHTHERLDRLTEIWAMQKGK